MRWLLLVALAASCLGTPARAQVEYRPTGGGMSVQFPAKPRIVNEQVSTRFGNARGVTASFERADGAKFYAIYTDYPPAAAQETPQRMLDSLKIGRLVKGTLRAEKRFQVEGNLAQSETIDLQVGTRPVIMALDVVRGLRVYSVFCIVDRDKENDPDVKQFLGTFALLPL